MPEDECCDQAGAVDLGRNARVALKTCGRDGAGFDEGHLGRKRRTRGSRVWLYGFAGANVRED